MAAITLIPILGDQLSFGLSSLRDADPHASVLLMAEAEDETTYVRHHRRKLAYILSAMRHHAEALRERGWTVEYVALDDPENSHSFTGEVARACERHDVTRIVVTEAGEWRVQAMLDAWETLFGVPVEIRSDTRFIASHAEFQEWAEGRDDLVEITKIDDRGKLSLAPVLAEEADTDSREATGTHADAPAEGADV